MPNKAKVPKYMIPPYDAGDVELLISKRLPRNIVELSNQVKEEAPHLIPFLEKMDPNRVQERLNFYRQENGLPLSNMQQPSNGADMITVPTPPIANVRQ